MGDINLPICKARNFGWRHFPKIESQEFGQESFLHLKLPGEANSINYYDRIGNITSSGVKRSVKIIIFIYMILG